MKTTLRIEFVSSNKNYYRVFKEFKSKKMFLEWREKYKKLLYKYGYVLNPKDDLFAVVNRKGIIHIIR